MQRPTGKGLHLISMHTLRRASLYAVVLAFVFPFSFAEDQPVHARFNAIGSLSSTSVVPLSLAQGATGFVVVAFTTTNFIAEGRVAVPFPSGFDVTGAGVNQASGVATIGLLSLLDVSGQVVTVHNATLTGGATANFLLTGIKNPVATGSTGAFGIQTQDFGGTPIDQDTSVVAVTIIAPTPTPTPTPPLTPTPGPTATPTAIPTATPVPGTSGLALMALAAALVGAAFILARRGAAVRGGGRARP